MEQPWDQTRLAHMAQKIVLLHQLNYTPDEPSENVEQYARERSNSRNNDSKRILSPHQEKRIAEAFAHLAANSDHPKRVMAVCVQEGTDGKFLLIKLAVNNGSVECMLKQLSKITVLLQQASHSEDDAFFPILHECISLNQNRALCRFRSRHAILHCSFKKEKKTRAKWVLNLSSTISQLSSSNAPQAQDLQSSANRLKDLYHDLEALNPKEAKSNPGLTVLVHMIMVCESVYSGLRAMNLRKNILVTDLQALKKIVRYTTICRELLRYSCLFPVFRSIKVVAVALPATPPARVDPDNFVQDAIRDISTLPQGIKLTAVAKKHGYPNVTDSIVSKASLKAPVHAEMQLLFHLEIAPTVAFLPRMICSNKKACLLCNLFFKIDGRFCIPSSHGRLYEKWALPATVTEKLPWTEMRTKLLTFEQALLGRITLQIKQARKPFQIPCESAIFHSATESVMTVSTTRPNQPSDAVEILNNRRDSGIGMEETAIPNSADSVGSLILTESPHSSHLTPTLQRSTQSLPVSSLSDTEGVESPSTSNGSETLSSLDDNLSAIKAVSSPQGPTEPLVTSPSTNLPARSSTPASLKSSPSFTHTEPMILQHGIPIFTTMTGRNGFLLVHTPKLHLTLCWDPPHQLYGEPHTALDKKGKQRIFENSQIRIERMSREAASLISHDQNDCQVIEVASLPEGLDMTEELERGLKCGIYLRHRRDLVHISIVPSL